MKTRFQISLAITLFSVGVLSVGIVGFTKRVVIKEWWEERHAEKLPPAVNRTNSSVNTNSVSNTNNGTVPPDSYNLQVPFTSQAPTANWDQDHDEFCEEAAVLMVGRYWQDRGIANTTDAEAALQLLKKFEVDELGYYYDTTAAETAKILTGVYDLEVELIQNPTIDDIRRTVAAGFPVIVPTAGRELGNPNFRSPGPLYHNVIIKGYTSDNKFITNDPGTRKGADYVYSVEVLVRAMHDWVPGTDRTKAGNGTPTGTPVMIVAKKK